MTNESARNFKKGFSSYIDILVALMNFLIILLTLLFFQKNIFTFLFGIFISGGLVVILIYTFIRNNPLYTYYLVGLVICGSCFITPLVMWGSWLGFPFFLDILYLYKIYRSIVQQSAGTTHAKANFIDTAGSMGLDISYWIQRMDTVNPEFEMKRRQMKESFKEQYNSNIILRNSMILSFSLIIVFILYFLGYFIYFQHG